MLGKYHEHETWFRMMETEPIKKSVVQMIKFANWVLALH